MRLLLDTHVFLWYITADPKLPDTFRIDEGAMSHLAGLPPLHRDPFDRLPVAQALQHELTVVTVDPDIAAYPISLLPVN